MSKDGGTSRVAFALSVGVAASLVILTLGVFFAIATDKTELSAEAATLASAVLGGAVGALATYLGQSQKNGQEYQRGYRGGLTAGGEPEPFSDEEQADGKPWQIEDDFRP